VQVFTIGHSTHSLERFVELLREHGVTLVADVRLAPGSRRLPHFGQRPLAEGLNAAGIGYEHLKELGGRRRPRPDTPNRGWEVEAFRGYADHMGSAEFARGFERLRALAGNARVAAMCAEALWWRCRRRLVSDAVVARGGTVRHIGADGRLSDHALPDFAVVCDGRLAYPATQSALDV